MSPDHRSRRLGPFLAAGLALLFAHAAWAAPQQTGPAAAKPATSTTAAKPAGGAKGISEIGSSREPIAIDSDRLDVYDKEGRAVFTGNVVAVQGETTMKCTVMSVLYENNRAGGEKTASAGGVVGGGLGESAIRKIDCSGPVTITTKTQTATGDRAEFDRVVNKVFLIGNAALSDGPNVTRGERVAYDLGTGVANVEGGRVRALIVPGTKDKDGKDKDGKGKDGKPKTR